MTRARDVADTQDNVGGAVPRHIAGKNLLINGGMDFWARGTSFTTSGTYSADRWLATIDAPNVGTISQQTSSLPSGFRYSIRCQRNSGNTGTAALGISQALETSTSIPAQGQTIVLSYWAKAGGNYSNPSSVLNVRINSGTGTDQSAPSQFGGWTGYAETAPDRIITTTWTRYQATYTVPAGATQLGVRFFMAGSGTAGANDWFEITGVQLEVGSVATPFSRAGGTLQGELSACQRYYWRANAFAETSYPILGFGAGNSATQARTIVPFPVQMRTKPAAIDFSTVSGFSVFTMNDSQWTVTAVTLDPNLSTSYSGWLSWTVASGLTANQPYYVRGNNNSSLYLGFSAEL